MGNESPLGTHNLWNTPGVELPGPFRALVRELRKSGVEGKRAFAVAWSRARHWAAESTNAETKAKWGKVVAQLEAARAKAKATPNTKTAHEPSLGLAIATSGDGSGKHDLVFFSRRSTPKVLTRGAELGDYPDGYGHVTRRRAATADEEKQIAAGRWVRVDQTGKKPTDKGYEKTRYRPGLVKASHDSEAPMPTCPNCSTELSISNLALAMPPALAKANAAKKTGTDSSTSGPSTTKNADTKSSVTVPPAWKSAFDQLVSKMMAKKSPGTTREQVEKAALALLKRRNGGASSSSDAGKGAKKAA